MLIVQLFTLLLLLSCDDVGQQAESTSIKSWELSDLRADLLRSEEELTTVDSLVAGYLADHCESIAAYREHIGSVEVGAGEGGRYFEALSDCRSEEQMGAALYVAMHRDQVKQVVRTIHDYGLQAKELEEHIASLKEHISRSEAREQSQNDK